MNPENIRYWFKMGVRVNTLYRIINELAFYINDFIPVDFIQEVIKCIEFFGIFYQTDYNLLFF
jgi:hypothetical protein